MTSAPHRFWRWLNPSDEVVANYLRQNEETSIAFRAVLADAEPGTYFRTLHNAVVASLPFGPPVDFLGLWRELANLEQRVADIEDSI